MYSVVCCALCVGYWGDWVWCLVRLCVYAVCVCVLCVLFVAILAQAFCLLQEVFTEWRGMEIVVAPQVLISRMMRKSSDVPAERRAAQRWAAASLERSLLKCRAELAILRVGTGDLWVLR